MRCRHQWEEVARSFTPSVVGRITEVDRCTTALMQQILFGLTTVELRCEKCGDIESRTLVGDVRR